jgi:hypothetical protein
MGEESSKYLEKRNAYSQKVKPEGNRTLGRPNSKWVDSIKMDVGELVERGID